MTAPSPRSTTSDLEAGRQIDRIVEEAMRVLIAGASGAIGRALVRRLRANQHEVFALTQSHDSAPALKENGAEPVIANALDGAAVKAAVGRIRPDAVIMDVLNQGLQGEYFGIAAYDAALGTKLLSDTVAVVARGFQADHRAHAQAIREAIERLGGRADASKTWAEYAAQYPPPKLANEADVLRYAASLERSAAIADKIGRA